MAIRTAVDYREERATLINSARSGWTEAEAREGGPTAEDRATFDRAMDQADELLERAKRIERLELAEGDLDAPQGRSSQPIDEETRERRSEQPNGDRQRVAYRHWLRSGEVRQEIRSEANRAAEYRDTIISTDGKGGYLILPVQISQDIVRQIDDMVFVRRLATVSRVTDAKKLGIRKKTSRMSDADWTTEVASVTEDTSMGFGRRDLEPQLMTKLAKVSIRTLQLSTDAEREVNDELIYKVGITEEKAFLTGDGSGKPLGIFTASANGISTARDVVAASATAFTADELIDVKYSIKQGYLNDPNAGWCMHRDAVKRARKLKNSGDGQYVWQAGLTAGAPDRILDVPYYMSEYAPNTFTAGLYVAALGNFRHYRIAEVVDLIIQRLVEKYSDTNEVGFIIRRFVDGAPIQEEAFARLKLAAS